jgi:phage-related holin
MTDHMYNGVPIRLYHLVTIVALLVCVNTLFHTLKTMKICSEAFSITYPIAEECMTIQRNMGKNLFGVSGSVVQVVEHLPNKCETQSSS